MADLGASIADATGSYAALVPVILAAVVVWAASLWVAGPRRRDRLVRRVTAGA